MPLDANNKTIAVSEEPQEGPPRIEIVSKTTNTNVNLDEKKGENKREMTLEERNELLQLKALTSIKFRPRDRLLSHEFH